MKTKTIFTTLFLGLVFSSNAQSTEPAGIKITKQETTTINAATDPTANPQTIAADGDIDKWRGNDKPKPKAATINGITDDSTNPQPAKANINTSRGNIKSQ